MRAIAFVALMACAVACPSALAHTQAAPAQQASLAYKLGRQYRNGNGVVADSARAFVYFEQAARSHHPAAMFAMSNMLAAGEGVARDDIAARRWLEAAAQMDYPEALQQMALHVQDGTLGYTRDERRALQLLRATAHAMKHRVEPLAGAGADAGQP